MGSTKQSTPALGGGIANRTRNDQSLSRHGHQRTRGKKHSRKKKQLISILADVATVGAKRMSETIGKAGLRDAAIGTGIAVDKMLALTGQLPSVQIANVIMPTPEERAEMRAVDAKLDEIAARLKGYAVGGHAAHTREDAP